MNLKQIKVWIGGLIDGGEVYHRLTRSTRSIVDTDFFAKEVELCNYGVSIWMWNVGVDAVGSIHKDPEEQYLRTSLVMTDHLDERAGELCVDG